MLVLFGAVFVSSLLGSTHCVGMCGPLAIWAAGGDQRTRRTSMLLATTLYHLGRLATYALAGAIAGGIGSLVNAGADSLGVQLIAAKIVGVVLVVLGVLQIARLVNSQILPQKATIASSANPKPSWISRVILWLRPSVISLPLPIRGLVSGTLTAFLPCGWLYLFAFTAAGTGHAHTGALVMVAFWLGTVPLLLTLVVSVHSVAGRRQRLISAVTAVLLIWAGCFTFAGRGFAELDSLADLDMEAPEVDLQIESDPDAFESQIERLTSTPLPCCQHLED